MMSSESADLMLPPTKKISIVPEALAYRSQSVPSRTRDLPLRHLSQVTIYDRSGVTVSIEKIVKNGPFSAIGLANYDDPDFMSKSNLVLLENITEYSLEYPYGQSAIIWLKTQTAHYAINSLSEAYEIKCGQFFKDATNCGHVINAFMNITGKRSVSRIMLKAIWLSGVDAFNFISSIAKQRSFLLDQFEQQGIKRFTCTQLYRTLSDDGKWIDLHPFIVSIQKEKSRQEQTNDLLTSSSSESDEPRECQIDVIPVEFLVEVVKSNELIAENLEEKKFVFTVIKDYNSIKIQLPTRLALHYQCPFCEVTIKRTIEETCIVETTRNHFQLHLQAGTFREPLAVKAHDWPRIPSRREWTRPAIKIVSRPDDLPISIDLMPQVS